jgi:hypothetical protein
MISVHRWLCARLELVHFSRAVFYGSCLARTVVWEPAACPFRVAGF